jgi:hypothetical protein
MRCTCGGGSAGHCISKELANEAHFGHFLFLGAGALSLFYLELADFTVC